MGTLAGRRLYMWVKHLTLRLILVLSYREFCIQVLDILLYVLLQLAMHF